MHVLIHFDLLNFSWYLFIVWLYITIGNWFYCIATKRCKTPKKKKKKRCKMFCNTFLLIKYVLEWNHMVESACTNLSHTWCWRVDNFDQNSKEQFDNYVKVWDDSYKNLMMWKIIGMNSSLIQMDEGVGFIQRRTC